MGVVLDIRHAATRVGFFQVIGHGVPHALIAVSYTHLTLPTNREV